MSRGDITADEVYADREMLNRLGYGIFDVNFGTSGVGFENIKDFSYVVAPDEDPKVYRRRVFALVNRYYPNELAKAIWDKFIDHKWVLSERAGREIDLITAAHDWFRNYSHAFLKEWTFRQPSVPDRFRSQPEPRHGLLDNVTSTLFPNIRELLEAGFTVTDVVKAAILEAANPGVWKGVGRKPKITSMQANHSLNRKKFEQPPQPDEILQAEDNQPYFKVKKMQPDDAGRYYVQLVANLSGHEPQSPQEAERRWREILEHKWYMSERAGFDVGLKAATLDYFRRLNLLREAETNQED